MDFWRAANLLGKRKWFIILSVIVTTVLTWGAAQIVGSRWQATVRFVSAQYSPLTAPGPGGSDNNAYHDPSIELKAAKNEAMKYEAIIKSRFVLEGAQRKAPNIQWPADLAMNVSFISTSPQVFDLQVLDANAARAQAMANALAESFHDTLHANGAAAAESTVKDLEKLLADRDAESISARHAMDQYRIKHEIMGASAAQTLESAQMRLREAQAQLREKSMEFSGLKENLTITTPVQQNPILRTIDDEIFIAQRALDTDKKRYGELHPKVKQDQETLDDLNSRRKSEASKQVAGATQQPNPAFARVKSDVDQLRQIVAGEQAQGPLLAAAINSAQAEVDRYKNLDTPLAQLKADVDQKSEPRSNIMGRLNSARQALDTANGKTPLSILALPSTVSTAAYAP